MMRKAPSAVAKHAPALPRNGVSNHEIAGPSETPADAF